VKQLKYIVKLKSETTDIYFCRTFANMQCKTITFFLIIQIYLRKS